MRNLPRRIFRERRRLAILAVLAALSGYLFFIGDERVVYGLPLPLAVSLTFAAGLSVVALISALLVPLTRTSFEAYGVTMFIYAILTARYPQLSLEQAPMPLLNMFIVLVGTQALYHLIYGDWLGRSVQIATHVDRATAVSTLDREALWLALNPDPETAALFAEDNVELIEPVADQPGTIRIVHRYDNGLFQERRLTFEQVKPGWAYRASYVVRGVNDRAGDMPNRQTLALDPRDAMTAIHIRWERHNYPLNKAILHWIDDWAGRQLDRKVNIAEAQIAELDADFAEAGAH